jgi:hypothetical protein
MRQVTDGFFHPAATAVLWIGVDIYAFSVARNAAVWALTDTLSTYLGVGTLFRVGLAKDLSQG